MKIRRLSSALAELDHIHEHIARANPKAASQVFLRIRRATRQLAEFPMAGRKGHVEGTREAVVFNLPYLVIYRVTRDSVEILRVLHTSVDRGSGTVQ